MGSHGVLSGVLSEPWLLLDLALKEGGMGLCPLSQPLTNSVGPGCGGGGGGCAAGGLGSVAATCDGGGRRRGTVENLCRKLPEHTSVVIGPIIVVFVASVKINLK